MEIYYYFIFFRTFIPMYSFIVPYLIETKKLPKNEVVTKITQNIFIATIFTALLSIFIIENFGYKIICIANGLIETLVFGMIFFMKEKQIKLGQFAGLLHGTTKSLEMISKSIIYTGSEINNSQYVNYTSLKSFSAIIANIIGQECFFITGNHEVSLYLTGISLVIAIVISFFIPNCSKIRIDTIDFTSKQFVFAFFYVISNLFFISTVVYSSYIFIEKKKSINTSTSTFGYLLFKLVYPFRICISWIIKFFSLLDKKITITYKFDENILIYGYVDALARIIGIVPFYYLANRNFTYISRVSILILLFLILLGLQYFTTKTNNLDLVYGLTILCLILSTICLGISNNGFKKYKKVHFIYCGTLLVSACFHALISYFSSKWNDEIVNRIKYYCRVNLIMILIGIFLAYFYNDKN